MEKEQILKELEPLFAKAEKEGLWFYSSYQQMWFTLKELRKSHNEGRFVWGVSNWQLRSPYEKLEELQTLKRNIEKQIEDVKSKIC